MFKNFIPNFILFTVIFWLLCSPTVFTFFGFFPRPKDWRPRVWWNIFNLKNKIQSIPDSQMSNMYCRYNEIKIIIILFDTQYWLNSYRSVEIFESFQKSLWFNVNIQFKKIDLPFFGISEVDKVIIIRFIFILLFVTKWKKITFFE